MSSLWQDMSYRDRNQLKLLMKNPFLCKEILTLAINQLGRGGVGGAGHHPGQGGPCHPQAVRHPPPPLHADPPHLHNLPQCPRTSFRGGTVIIIERVQVSVFRAMWVFIFRPFSGKICMKGIPKGFCSPTFLVIHKMTHEENTKNSALYADHSKILFSK